MNTQKHDGQRLKKWIRHKKFKVIRLAKLLGMNYSNSVAYYYRQEQIKKSTLEKICTAMGITLDEFYKGPLYYEKFHEDLTLSEVEPGYGFSVNQGELLKKLFESNNAMVKAVADKWHISRPTLYGYFRSEKLDDSVILKASQHFKVPTSYFVGNTKDYFKENDIWVLLQKILEMNVEMKLALERMEQRFFNQDTNIPDAKNLMH